MLKAAMTVDVEEWFNILDIPGEIPLEKWSTQQSRLPDNLERMLELFQKYRIKATCFWLGSFAEKYPGLVRRTAEEGHEVASHGYAHLLAFQVGRKKFREDIRKGKDILENIISKPVLGFRAAGFSTTCDTDWAFEEIRSAGFIYDSSVFPASRGHGGMRSATIGPYEISTQAGSLLEIPQSVITLMGKRISLFGGGYLRLAPWHAIQWGIHRLATQNLPLTIYVHPREIDPDHPRLQMSLFRHFKSYVNLKSTYRKLELLSANYQFSKMADIADEFRSRFNR